MSSTANMMRRMPSVFAGASFGSGLIAAGVWNLASSSNPLERFNREIGRRTDAVGIFPDDASVIRLVSMLAIEANDEWLVGRAYISQKSMTRLDATHEPEPLALEQDQEEAEQLIAA